MKIKTKKSPKIVTRQKKDTLANEEHYKALARKNSRDLKILLYPFLTFLLIIFLYLIYLLNSGPLFCSHGRCITPLVFIILSILLIPFIYPGPTFFVLLLIIVGIRFFVLRRKVKSIT